ncbi:Isocitrate dehydrogenase [NADP] [Serratia plymuthica]|nr:Isocitrate dehydrogenase [NADP] [Serratia plymuthica]
MGWFEAADLIVKCMEGSIAAKTVSYDFECFYRCCHERLLLRLLPLFLLNISVLIFILVGICLSSCEFMRQVISTLKVTR